VSGDVRCPTVHLRASQPSDWADDPYLGLHSIALVMLDPVGAIVRRRAVHALRDEVVAACADIAIDEATFIARGRVARAGS